MEDGVELSATRAELKKTKNLNEEKYFFTIQGGFSEGEIATLKFAFRARAKITPLRWVAARRALILGRVRSENLAVFSVAEIVASSTGPPWGFPRALV